MERERRTSHLLHEHWNNIRGKRLFPSESDLIPEHLHEVWDHCFLIQALDIRKVENYSYSYFGKALYEAYQNELRGLNHSALCSPNAHNLAPLYHQVLEQRIPILEDEDKIRHNGFTIHYRQCLLPFGPDDNTVDFILGAMRYKIF